MPDAVLVTARWSLELRLGDVVSEAPDRSLVRARVDAGGGELDASGRISLGRGDLAQLAPVLERMLRHRVGAAGMRAEWLTFDEDLELRFAVPQDDTTASGALRVEGRASLAAVGVIAAIELPSAHVSAAAIRRFADGVAETIGTVVRP